MRVAGLVGAGAAVALAGVFVQVLRQARQAAQFWEHTAAVGGLWHDAVADQLAVRAYLDGRAEDYRPKRIS